MEVFSGVNRERLCELLGKVNDTRIAVLGDICLDVYWLADMKRSELSRETPHFPLPVIEERMSPGGGANVAANLAALKPARVFMVGVAGEDWRGTELLRLLGIHGIDTSHVSCVPGIVTNAYCKPLRAGISKTVYEDPRLDFCNYNPLSLDTENSIIASLDKLAPGIDALCVSDQIHHGIGSERIRNHVMKLSRAGLTVVVDSRNRIGEYRNVILKPNEIEGAKAVGIDCIDGVKDFASAAMTLSHKCDSEVLMTIGQLGALYADKKTVTHIPARRIDGEIDIVGAGDTFLSGFTIAIAAGASRPEAAFLAARCSEITIQKIGTTGAASADEVLLWFDSSNPQ